MDLNGVRPRLVSSPTISRLHTDKGPFRTGTPVQFQVNRGAVWSGGSGLASGCAILGATLDHREMSRKFKHAFPSRCGESY
jgi:hypothetical protein